MVIGLHNQLLNGLQDNRRRFERAASDLHRAYGVPSEDKNIVPRPETPDPIDATARLLAARRGFEACLAAADSADEMLGNLIDTLA